MNRWPGINEWLFGVKTFAAAALALYVAMAVGLDRPYWAMATVYIVSQPLTGSLRSKALFRLLGTFIGATATVVLVPNLVNAPELLCAALALWTGSCLYLSLLDRTPRSYVFMLAGYTAALIGFPSVSTPEQMWDIAVARTEEVSLGIICATVVGTVVFPRPLGPMLGARILSWVGNASAWAEEVLGSADATLAPMARNRLAADAIELRMLTTQLAYDTSALQSATRWVGEVQRRMVLLLPLLSSIADRIRALRAANGVTPGLDRLLAELRVWVRAGAPPPRTEADRLRAEIADIAAEADPRAAPNDVWNAAMRGSLLLRLRELIDVRQDMRDLRQHIEAGGGALATPLALPIDGPERLHVDRGMALFSALAAVLTILVLCFFWIETGWQAGAGLAELGAVACSFFATLDDPAPVLWRFVIIAFISIVAVGIGLFGILPLAHDFETLTLALGAFFVPVGVLMAIPATQSLGSALGFITATLLSLQSSYAADFVSYADGGMSALLGVSGAAVMTSLMRSVGAEWSARRLLRAGWRDLAAIPRSRWPQERTVLAGLLLDRIGLLVPRLAAAGTDNDLAAADALLDLRVGINMVELQHDREALPAMVLAAVDEMLLGVATHYAVQAALRHVWPPPVALLRQIDHALDAAIAASDAPAGHLLPQLVGIRRGLFADAEPYRAAAPPQPVVPADAEPAEVGRGEAVPAEAPLTEASPTGAAVSTGAAPVKMAAAEAAAAPVTPATAPPANERPTRVAPAEAPPANERPDRAVPANVTPADAPPTPSAPKDAK